MCGAQGVADRGRSEDHRERLYHFSGPCWQGVYRPGFSEQFPHPTHAAACIFARTSRGRYWLACCQYSRRQGHQTVLGRVMKRILADGQPCADVTAKILDDLTDRLLLSLARGSVGWARRRKPFREICVSAGAYAVS